MSVFYTDDAFFRQIYFELIYKYKWNSDPKKSFYYALNTGVLSLFSGPY